MSVMSPSDLCNPFSPIFLEHKKTKIRLIDSFATNLNDLDLLVWWLEKVHKRNIPMVVSLMVMSRPMGSNP